MYVSLIIFMSELEKSKKRKKIPWQMNRKEKPSTFIIIITFLKLTR